MDIKQNYSGMVVKNHYFSVPLDYDNNDSERLDIFAREIRSIKSSNMERPYLCFFQGGPGYEAPRPITYSGWIKRLVKSIPLYYLTKEAQDSVAQLHQPCSRANRIKILPNTYHFLEPTILSKMLNLFENN